MYDWRRRLAGRPGCCVTIIGIVLHKPGNRISKGRESIMFALKPRAIRPIASARQHAYRSQRHVALGKCGDRPRERKCSIHHIYTASVSGPREGFMQTLVQRAFATRVVFALVMAAIVGVAHAADDKGYRTGTIIASDYNECRGVPSCFSATSPAVTVPPAGRKAERFACPGTHPNLWAWDAAQNEQIQVRLVGADKSTATIEGVNAAKVAGVFVVSLGCSTEPYAGSGLHMSRLLAPTDGMRGRPASRILRPGAGQPDPDDPCVLYNIASCQPQKQISFYLQPWATVHQVYACKGAPYVYPYGYTYSQSGSPSVSAFWDGGTDPLAFGIILTNWNPVYADLVEITIACTSINHSAGNCGDPQSDPGCPLIQGSQQNHCTGPPVPVCFQTYEERCTANNQRYSCTIDLGISWCSPCPG